ncbi:MAG: hypothetical protein O7173_03645 [Wolbachia endosymbiont of Nomada fabriciana]|uniref:hypothetical protein n=1 Tax=unclassified Wolbachia TaxID=2640676 RepID=UPI0022265B13|nr:MULTISPECIES: hypothetical protein [unclassified Wolbachia]MDX5496730.1 hypothetical protein [Wolbachia endosymbiont of Nomada fabriciana]MDX5507300.1 hypothetical protein [Wolbachia endosymbiont of Hylaeus sinuatus]MDX5518356.1 hypothetical protein [Wolbachia endosymbiont of Andrena agilissima]MDX5526478.1 hypothetical protein [Wolbachia endosymbiont of Andrena nigroaenea]MDX5527768.1 hypothetical protein [Wolbachia endosymbiont of Andrena minutula]MEC4734643.1 hypothetical protein [Wolba
MNIAICRQFAWQMKVADTGIQFLLPGVKLSFLDSSVKHWDDTSGHCRHKGTSVSYFHGINN